MAKTPAKPSSSSTTASQFVTLPVIEIEQGDFMMYSFVAQSDLLRKIATVSRRAEDAEKVTNAT